MTYNSPELDDNDWRGDTMAIVCGPYKKKILCIGLCLSACLGNTIWNIEKKN